ncbi:MAG: hypothetical protein AB2L12_08555 [Smithellaceae bacterium]
MYKDFILSMLKEDKHKERQPCQWWKKPPSLPSGAVADLNYGLRLIERWKRSPALRLIFLFDYTEKGKA